MDKKTEKEFMEWWGELSKHTHFDTSEFKLVAMSWAREAWYQQQTKIDKLTREE